jgi:hypothetical protein
MRQSEFIDEYINPDAIQIGWQDQQPILGGKYVLKAEVEEDFDGKPLLHVKVYDPSQGHSNFVIGSARFKIGRRLFGKHLIAKTIHVDDTYQRQGIATAIYQYIIKLGHTVKPSFTQLGPGKAMWKSFKRTGALR